MLVEQNNFLMTDDEVLQAILDKIDEFDQQCRDTPLSTRGYIMNYLGVESERRAIRLVNTLLNEGLLKNNGQSWGSGGEDQLLTEKGRRVIENGGWPAYKAAMEERERKATEAARLADIKAKGEALQFKYWWVGLAGFAISVLTAGWTIYQDTTDDAPTRAEFDRVRAELNSLRKSQAAPLPTPVKSTKPTSTTAK